MRLKETRMNTTGAVQVLHSRQYDGNGQIQQGHPVQTPQRPEVAVAPVLPPNRSKLLEHSKSHPRMLRSNATSHIWAFGALAELVDNAQDDEAKANRIWISGDEQPMLGATIKIADNGLGLSRERLHRMLSFGYSRKEHTDGNVGRFGVGFKSGSIRLGDDVVILTREEHTTSLALLSLSFLESENLDDILIPMLTWETSGGEPRRVMPHREEEWQWSVQIICRYSFLRSEAEILRAVQERDFRGTTITIFNLRQPREFLFTETDFLLKSPDSDVTATNLRAKYYQQDRDGQQATLEVKEDYSLRSYIEILYLDPTVEIFLQGHAIRFRDPRMFLAIQRKEFGPYTPKAPGVTGSIRCWFGYNDESGKLCGTHIYNKNRLIRMYQRFGSQLQANCMMKDMLGVAVADCLTPTHNKQDFDKSTTVYARFKAHMVGKMNEYYYNHQNHRQAGKGQRQQSRRARARKLQEADESEEEEDESQMSVSDDEEAQPTKKRKVNGSQATAGNQQSAPQEEWRSECVKLRGKIVRHWKSLPFRQPVDVEHWGCPDYYSIIKEPMDLATVLHKMKDYSPLEFRHDMMQIFKNAFIYNDPRTPVYQHAEFLEKMFLTGWKKVVEKLPPSLAATLFHEALEADAADGAQPTGADAAASTVSAAATIRSAGSEADPCRRGVAPDAPVTAERQQHGGSPPAGDPLAGSLRQGESLVPPAPAAVREPLTNLRQGQSSAPPASSAVTKPPGSLTQGQSAAPTAPAAVREPPASLRRGQSSAPPAPAAIREHPLNLRHGQSSATPAPAAIREPSASLQPGQPSVPPSAAAVREPSTTEGPHSNSTVPHTAPQDRPGKTAAQRTGTGAPAANGMQPAAASQTIPSMPSLDQAEIAALREELKAEQARRLKAQREVERLQAENATLKRRDAELEAQLRMTRNMLQILKP